MMKYVTVLMLVLFQFLELSLAKNFRYAACEISPNPSKPDSKVEGIAVFRQAMNGGPTEYKLSLSGFNKKDDVKLHGFHVHTLGTIKSGCEAAGGHYNPKGVNHGAPENPKRKRHVGDLGNIEESEDGSLIKYGVDRMISLRMRNNIIGRALMIHAGEDDLGLGGDQGSLATGNAGARLACCTIAVSDEATWESVGEM